MLSRIISVVALAATLTGALQAQAVQAVSYGSSGLYNTPLDPDLVLSIAVDDDDRAELKLAGGLDGDIAILAVSASPAALPLGCCASVLVNAPMISVAGIYQGGEWSIRFDAGAEGLAGATLYAQGVDVIQSGGLSLAQGLRMDFASQ